MADEISDIELDSIEERAESRDTVRVIAALRTARRERDQAHTSLSGLTEQLTRVVAHHIQESRIKTLENEVFALKDGLRGRDYLLKKAEARAARAERYEAIVQEVSAAVDEIDLSLEGTLVERVRQAAKMPRWL